MQTHGAFELVKLFDEITEYREYQLDRKDFDEITKRGKRPWLAPIYYRPNHMRIDLNDLIRSGKFQEILKKDLELIRRLKLKPFNGLND